MDAPNIWVELDVRFVDDDIVKGNLIIEVKVEELAESVDNVDAIVLFDGADTFVVDFDVVVPFDVTSESENFVRFDMWVTINFVVTANELILEVDASYIGVVVIFVDSISCTLDVAVWIVSEEKLDTVLDKLDIVDKSEEVVLIDGKV